MLTSKIIKYEYAKSLESGKIIHISELEEGRTGKKCNCVCHHCSQKMWAKRGEERAWHFAHEPGLDDCVSPEIANETALHKIAKSMFEEQKAIYTAQVAELDKPENVKAGIVNGKINKHLAEICFMDQPFVKDDKVSVEKYLAANGVKLVDYVRFEKGEGLEKKEDDFAAEVASMAK